MLDFFKGLKRSTIIFFIIFTAFFAGGVYCLKSLSGTGVIKKAVQIDNGVASSENEGKTVYASGKLKIDNSPCDNETGVTAEGYILKRNVEVYQYEISDDTVAAGYYDYQLKNITGENGESYTNPVFPESLKSEIFLADVSFADGNLVLGYDYVATIGSGYKNVDASFVSLEDLPEFENEYNLTVNTYDGVTGYYSGNPADPQIGDIRVTYEYIPESDIEELSVFGIQKDGRIESGSQSFASMAEGTLTADEFYKEITSGTLLTVIIYMFFACVFLILTVISSLRGKVRMNFKSRKTASVILAFALVVSFTTLCRADFGDYGGDYDYGGYDSYDSYDSYDYGDYDSDYDSDDYDSGGFFFFDDDNETTASYYYSYNGYPCADEDVYNGEIIYKNTSNKIIDSVNLLDDVDVSSDSVIDSMSGFWTLCVFLIILVFIFKSNKKGPKNGNKPRPEGAARTDQSSLTDIKEYSNIDDKFSLEDFKNDISDLYVKLQNGWQKKNIEDLRPYLTDAFYAQCDRQLRNYKRNSQTNIIEDITVENVNVKGFMQDGTNDLIVLELTAKIKDYVIDDNTGNVVRGNKEKFRRMQYEWTLLRATGKKTGADLTENSVCPHCGAPLTLNAASQCEYCGSLITSEASDWALKEIRGLSQTTLG